MQNSIPKYSLDIAFHLCADILNEKGHGKYDFPKLVTAMSAKTPQKLVNCLRFETRRVIGSSQEERGGRLYCSNVFILPPLLWSGMCQVTLAIAGIMYPVTLLRNVVAQQSLCRN